MLRHVTTAAGIVLALSPMPASAQASPPAGPRAELVNAYEEVGADTGALYGVRIGYDFPVARNIVIGLEGEASNSTLDTSFTSSIDPDFVVSSETDFGRLLYGGGRIALGVTPRVSIYARGGYVNRRLSGRVSIGRVTPSGAITEIASQRFQTFNDGMRLGVGAQAQLIGSLYGGVEYRFDTYERLPDSHQTALTLGLRF